MATFHLRWCLWLVLGLLGSLVLPTLDAASAMAAGDKGSRPTSKALRFFVVGDAPYSSSEYGPLERLMMDAARRGTPFIIHVGDIKGGSQPCSDARIARIATLFRRQPVAMLYTPGDNEWTDCRRRAAGGLDSLEQLSVLRKILLDDPEVLHNQSLGLTAPDPAYPENAYFAFDDVVFTLVHVVGSKNNYREGDSAALAEFEARMGAAQLTLEAAADLAVATGARAMVIAFHANPLFERSRALPGFAPLFNDLDGVLDRYSGPVLAIHGDTHRFQFNQPLTDPDRGEDSKGDRFWRLEVPGSPLVGGVWVTVDPDVGAAEPFRVDVTYPSLIESLDSSLAD